MPRQSISTAILAAALVLGLAACEEEPSAPVEKKGREETRGIRNTEAIGYAGEAMADHIDESLDAAEEHERKLRQAAEDAGLEPEQPPGS